MGRLAKFTGRWGRTTTEIEAAELRVSTGGHGTRIGDLKDRELAVVSGTVRALTLPPKGQVPALIAELYDGSGAVRLVWLGRREIRGIGPGTYLRARGRIAYRRGVATIFNPLYEILPRRDR